jgi:hypothetical protein
VQSLPGWEKRVRVVEGALPGPTPRAPTEVVISERSSQLAGLSPASASSSTCPAARPDECDPIPEPVTVVVVGVVEPLVPLDSFWAAGSASYLEPYFTETPPGLVLPILLPAEQFNLLLDRLPEDFTGYRGWYSFTDPQRLTRGTVSRALSDVAELDRLVAGDQGVAFSPMGHTCPRVRARSRPPARPLAILLLEIAAIALFYLVLVSSAVLDRQSREISPSAPEAPAPGRCS